MEILNKKNIKLLLKKTIQRFNHLFSKKIKPSSHNFPLLTIVCGFEHGGTTLLADILKQHPLIDMGFEGGFLLANQPQQFVYLKPYYQHLKAGWGLSDADAREVCNSKSWGIVYKKLINRSKMIPRKNVVTVDKTPKYMQQLSTVMKKIPGTPCIVITRDPRAIYYSWKKRKIVDMNNFIHRYNSYAAGLKKALKQKKIKDNILVIQYEEFCKNPDLHTKKIFNFLHLNFNENFLNIDNHHKNVYQNNVTSNHIREYKKYLTDDECYRILKKTKKFHKLCLFEPKSN